MNKRLLFKLLPVMLLAAVGIVWSANRPPSAEAGISTVTATQGLPSTVTVGAENGAGIVTVTATGGTLTCAVSCSGNGTSTVAIDLGSSVVKTAATISLTLNGTCAAGGTIVVTAVQSAGTITATSGQTSVSCTVSCANVLLAGCCDGLNTSLFVNQCGCFNGLNTSSLLLNNGCGCFNGAFNGCGCVGGFNGLNTVTLGNQLFGNGCGCFNGFGNTALTLNNCGCVSGFQSNALLANCGCVGGINNGLVVGGTNFGFGTNNFGFGTNFVNNNNCTANQVSVTVPGSATCGSTTNVLVSVRNTINGIALDGTPVVVSSTMGSISPTQTFTSGGIASATLLLPANAAGTATITAAAAGLTGNASIVVSCNVVPVAPAPIVLPAPFATAPIVITGPNTGDGGCFVNVCTE